MKVITSHICPPIPVHSFDWMAHFDGQDEDGPRGWGSTEQEAVNDLFDNTDIEDLARWFNISTFAIETHRDPDYGQWVAHTPDGLSAKSPWRETAIADLAFRLCKLDQPGFLAEEAQ